MLSKTQTIPHADFFTEATRAFPFSPEWESTNKAKARTAVGLWPQLFGIVTVRSVEHVSVPYMEALKRFSSERGQQPTLELASYFAETATAAQAINHTINLYRETLTQQLESKPIGALTLVQAGQALCVSRHVIRGLISHTQIPITRQDDRANRGYAGPRIVINPADLPKLFEWHYPENYSGPTNAGTVLPEALSE
ncbi:MAG TPA: hypothetical protein VF733_05655 [Candidatus Saccharimonadales bacterium]